MTLLFKVLADQKILELEGLKRNGSNFMFSILGTSWRACTGLLVSSSLLNGWMKRLEVHTQMFWLLIQFLCCPCLHATPNLPSPGLMMPRANAEFSDEINFHSVSIRHGYGDSGRDRDRSRNTHTCQPLEKKGCGLQNNFPEDFIQTSLSFCSFAKGSWRKRVF